MARRPPSGVAAMAQPQAPTPSSEVARIVESARRPRGPAAQSKIQSYPGDCDYFERVNIIAPTRQEACRILAEVMREKAISTAKGPTHQLIEVKFGSYPFDVVKDGRPIRAGSPISWKPEEIRTGQIEGFRPNGGAAAIGWYEASAEPGWCKLDWGGADPARQQLANASHMLDVPWGAPGGPV